MVAMFKEAKLLKVLNLLIVSQLQKKNMKMDLQNLMPGKQHKMQPKPKPRQQPKAN